MEYVKLAHSDWSFSRFVFGTEALGGMDWGKVDVARVQTAIHEAIDAGINAFDTANVYGLGLSESRLKSALGPRRHDMLIITKFGVNWDRRTAGVRARTYRDASPRHVFEALEGSLRRLGLDRIPLYLIHWPDRNTPLCETMAALEQCRAQGMIQHVGVSNFTAEMIREANNYVPLRAVQTPYNLLDRQAEDQILAVCEELSLTVLVYGPLAQGLLTGKFNHSGIFDSTDRRSRLPHFQEDALDHNLRIVNYVRMVARNTNRSLAQVSLRWLLDNPRVNAIVVGVKQPEQLHDNLGAFGWKLSAKHYHFLNGLK